jgi:hypothetical protein
MTNIEFVSEIAGILKTINKDNKLPRRLILRAGQEIATSLISQKLMDRTISSETNLFTRIECFEFDKIETKNCPSIEFRMCKTLMKSKKPLPKLVFSRLGASVKDVVSLDGDFTFTFVDESQYRRNKKRQNQLKNQIFIYLGSDNHLYIPDREILSIDLVILTTDIINANKCSSCAEENCKSNWDYSFIVPDKLIETVKDLTIQRLGLTRQMMEDQNPNNIEGA